MKTTESRREREKSIYANYKKTHALTAADKLVKLSGPYEIHIPPVKICKNLLAAFSSRQVV